MVHPAKHDRQFIIKGHSKETLMLHTIFGILIFILTLGVIMIRPYRISEALAAAVGAGLMLLGGFLLPGEAVQLLAGEWNIYGFFLGLMTIAAIAGRLRHGCFRAVPSRP